MIMRSVVKHIRNDFFDKKRLYYFFNSAEVRTLRKGDVVDIIKETENSFNEFLFDKTYFLIILSSSKVNKMKNLHNKYRRLTFPDWSGLVKAIFCLTPCSADRSASLVPLDKGDRNRASAKVSGGSWTNEQSVSGANRGLITIYKEVSNET